MNRKPWSGYAPVEATLEMLASALRDVKGRMRQVLAQERTAWNAGLFLDGLLSDEKRKTAWMRSDVVGDPVLGGNRSCLGETVGMPMCCAISYASTWSNICTMTKQFW
jgi:hypothetical protein